MKGLAIAISLLIVGVASADSLRAQLDKTNKTIDKYFLAKDAKGFTAYLKANTTSNFVYIEDGRTENRDQMLAGIVGGFAQMKKITRANLKTLTLQEHGSSATSTAQHMMEGVTMGPDHKTHTMTFTGVARHTYVKQGGKWLMSKMEWVKQSMLMDGKPVTAPK